MRGIDVSKHNGVIDYSKLPDVDFVMVKATQGLSMNRKFYLFMDSRFRANVVNASKFGKKVGVYHFLTATSNEKAIEEMTFFVNAIAPFRKYINFEVAIDVEDDRMPRSKYQLGGIVATCENYLHSVGYDPVIYTNPAFLKYRLPYKFSTHPLWLAKWGNPPKRGEYPKLRMWQYGTKYFRGISQYLDSNLTADELY